MDTKKMRFKIMFICGLLLQFSALTMAQRVYDVTQFGAIGDGKALDSKAIQKAVDKCFHDGGGVVVVPKGTYLSATIQLKDHVNLHLEKEAHIIGATDYTKISTGNLPPGRTDECGTSFFTAAEPLRSRARGPGA